MEKEKYAGYVKTERVYILITVSLLIGFLSGVVLAVYKSPGTTGNPPPTVTQEQTSSKHDMAAVESQVIATPDDPGAWTHLGNAYFDTDQPAKAIKAYIRSIELAPGNPDVLTDLGVMYRRSNQPDQALLAFDQAIQAAPAHEQARLNKGVVLLYDKQNQTKAFAVWEELLAINPMAQIPSGQLLEEFMAELQKK
jgi:cytochrome c-type biogenesis protein CcmH/NrfG